MRALVAAELNRLRSRRLTLITLLVVVVAAGLFQFAVHSAVSPPSAEELAAAQTQLERDLQQYEKDKEVNAAAEQDCLDQGGRPEDCDFKPRLEMYVSPAVPFAEIASQALTFAAVFAGLGVFLVGASSIGAEYTSGSISNWLTFVPQRWKVFTAKALAMVLGAGLAGTVVVGGTLAVTAVLASSNDLDLAGGRALIASAARGVGLVVALGLVGYGIALIARHTAAAMGVLVGYGLLTIVVNILFNVLPALQRVKQFLPENNLLAFLNKGHSYTDFYPGVGVDGEGFSSVERTISITQGGTYWLLLTAITLAAALLIFRRRDVV
ncbi:MAG TPA: ABC transporter permease subunit [Propionibacteriaceae bacterium]|nr:ABC transporter permease subunit [Propionibacteriaceae bacterium]